MDEHELRIFIKLNSGSTDVGVMELVKEAKAKLKKLLDALA